MQPSNPGKQQGDAKMGLRGLGRGVWLAAAAGLVMTATIASHAAAPDDVIAQRRAGYKHMGEVFKAMKDGVAAGADVQQFASGAGDIVAWATKIPTMFPPGSETGGGTHALPSVWSDRAGFEKLSGDLKTEATKLQEVAGTGDKAAFAAQFKATGAVCGQCHRTYRAKI
jgi:cytochrome c556